jgi:hypothetical protein
MTDTSKLHPLCDIDSVVYAAGFGADSQVVKSFMDTLGCDKEAAVELAAQEDYLSHALGNAKQMLQDAVREFDADNARFFLTGSGNYREQIATLAPYKGNRTNRKPRYYNELRSYLVHNWGAEVVEGMEADDMVSILQYAKKDKSTVIVTIDKDLGNTPGWHYNPKKSKLEYITLAEADLNFWKQVATGDRTDNIPGLHRVGDKTVQKALSDCGGDIERFKSWVARMYDKQYNAEGPHAMWENATLLWMQRRQWVNWDGTNIKEVSIGKEEESHAEEGS